MIDLKLISKIDADYEVILVVNENLDDDLIKDKEILKNIKFEDHLNLFDKKRLYIKVKNISLESLRLALFKAVKILKSQNIKNFSINSYDDKNLLSFVAMAEGAIFGAYEFDKYKSKKSKNNIKEIYIISKDDLEKKQEYIKKGIILANATNYAKDGVNEIPYTYTPIKMADNAKELASNLKNVECKILDKKALKDGNFNAMLAVASASANEPRVIHLHYKPKDPKFKLTLVGKGLTYDTGGLSLKPSDFMLTMKSDKSGALACMGVIKAVAELGLDIEINAILGACENSIGKDSYRPDDVLISRSGTTIEVRNTDAEGRLVLADCLNYAQEFKGDLIIDIATLTGACVVGLGEYTIGVMGHNDSLRCGFVKNSKDSGELCNPLLFNDYLKDLLKSNIADISNIASSRYGGSITAGLFLDKFIKEEFKDKWLHLDIAGPAYLEKAWGYNSFGASGASIRAIVYYLLNKENLWA